MVLFCGGRKPLVDSLLDSAFMRERRAAAKVRRRRRRSVVVVCVAVRDDDDCDYGSGGA